MEMSPYPESNAIIYIHIKGNYWSKEQKAKRFPMARAIIISRKKKPGYHHFSINSSAFISAILSEIKPH